MIKVYGIKTCNSVRNALKFFKDNNIEVEFSDIRKDAPKDESIDSWVQKAGIDIAFNSRGTKYRTLKLKELNLDDEGKLQWLKKEPMLLKRPVIEYDDKVMIGFNEDTYKKTFL